MAGMLLYDGECRFCTTSALWLRRHAVSPADVRAWQSTDLDRLGVTADDCAAAVQWVGNGQRAAGPAALAAYLQTSSGAWRTTGRLLAVPAAQGVARPLYRWLAPHRGRPGRPPRSDRSPRSGPVGPPGISIRPRRERDLGACARLLRLVHAAGQYPVYWPSAPRAWLADDGVLAAWVAESRGEVVGHVAIRRVGPDRRAAQRWREITGYGPDRLAGVSQLFVRPRAQGQGIGSELLAVAVRAIRARGLVPVLEVVTASRDAIAMYEARGWRLAGIDDWGRPADRLRVFYYLAPLDPPA